MLRDFLMQAPAASPSVTGPVLQSSVAVRHAWMLLTPGERSEKKGARVATSWHFGFYDMGPIKSAG